MDKNAVILYKESPSLSREGFYNLEGFNHHIGLVMEKIQSLLLVFVDESYVFEAAGCERIEGWGYR
ncbi:hypothetical protein KEH51_00710 [[Brevibacterium] frigoritolerans]|uniref:Uncharacterized protein n=1 Tax=Peribacillus frigoritolerans TaxID=450367 RepID=A0A941FFH5_9BACI|nr:hypothetical protein [Peribacillus frigoritolerans]